MKKHLDAWYAEVEKGSWKDPAELKAQFRSASIVSSERVEFNIKGNDYRLVVAINWMLLTQNVCLNLLFGEKAKLPCCRCCCLI